MIVPLSEALVFLLGAAAFVLMTIAILGRRDPAQPCCRACRVMAEPRHLIAGEPCGHCGAALSGERDILPRWRPATRRTWLMLAAAVTLFVGSMFGARAAARALAPAIAPVTPFGGPLAPIVDGAIWSPEGNVRPVHLLLARLRSGGATNAELGDAILKSLARPDAPLPAPNREVLLRLGAAAMDAPSNESALARALLEALEPAPHPRASTRGDKECMLEFQPVGAQGWSDPSASMNETLLWSTQIVRAVRVDGRPVAFRPARGAPAMELALSRHCAAIVIDSLPPGRHEIEVDLDAVLLEAFDGRRMARIDYRRQDGIEWPTPRSSLPRTVLLVVGEDAAREERAPADPEGDPNDSPEHDTESRAAP